MSEWSGYDDSIEAVQPWPEGSYKGRLTDHAIVSSWSNGTPGFKLTFEVDGQSVEVKIWITKESASIAIDQLNAVGWNGEFTKAEFDPPDEVILYMKRETYKGKIQERWNISTFEVKPPPTDESLAWFAARFKAQTSPPSAPIGAPLPASPPPPPPPRPKASSPNGQPATQETAWAAWTAAGKTEDADGFWRSVEAVAGTTDASRITPDQWRAVIDSVPPF